MQRLLKALATLLLLTLVASAALPTAVVDAAASPLSEEEALATLQAYNIVQGDGSGDLQLDSPITRAQAAAIFVRAMGAANLVALVADTVPFADARGHWGAGEIAMVHRLGLMKGDGDGRFRPNDPITYAEILTVMLRMVEREPAGAWNADAILARAADLGIASAGLSPWMPATRRGAFLALATAITAVPVGNSPSLVAKNLDQKPPVISLNRVSSPTSEEKVTIKGKAVGAMQVLIDGEPAKFNLTDETFTYTAALAVGDNSLTVEAIDAAGNRASETLHIERRGAISRITITGPKSFVVNAATKLTVDAQDRSGNPVPAEGLEAEVTGGVATFDPVTATLVTGDRTGKGTLTLTSGSARATFSFTVVAPSSAAQRLLILPINKDVPIALNQKQTVTVQVVDMNGKVVSDDFGRTIRLSSAGATTVIVTPIAPITDKGVATFVVEGTAIGLTTLTASADGLESATRPLQVLTDLRVMLVPSKKSLAPDGSSSITIKATLQDVNGRQVNNTTGKDMRIVLTASGTDSKLTNPDLIIAQGKSDSGSTTAKLTAGILPGVASIEGYFTSSHSAAIQTLLFPVETPLAGSRLELVAPETVAPGEETTVTLQVVDGNGRLVTDGSYAFQLKVTSSNNEAKVRGLPQGVGLTFLGSPYYPVDDGADASDADNDPYSVVGRTYRGEATVRLTYPRSGRITIQAVPLPTAYEAYHPAVGLGPASSSLDLWNPPLEVAYTGQAARIDLTADSALGRDLEAGAIGSSGTVTLRVRVVDENGTLVPGYNELITLTRLNGGDKVTNVTGIYERRAVNGLVEFTLQAWGEEGFDQYQVTDGRLVSQPLTVAVWQGKAATPNVVAIRGMSEFDADPTAGYVGPDADYMDVQLQPQVGDPRLAEYWVLAKVYRENQSSPIYTQLLNLRDPVPIIRVPRSSLTPGTARYRVVLNNGYGDTAYSSTLDPITEVLVAAYGEKYDLKSAAFDAQEGRLILQTAGLSAQGSLDLSKLTLVKGANTIRLDEGGVAKVTSISSSRVLIDLGTLADRLDPDTWNGLVYLEADEGWYADKAGTGLAEAFDEIAVTPMATISGGALDVNGRRLYVSGVGLTQGSIKWNLVQVQGQGAARIALNTSYDKVARLTDTEAIITLSKATYEAIMNLSGSHLYLTADTGWIQTGSSSSAARGAALTGTGRDVLLRLLATAASYDAATDTLTLRGDGLKGMTLDPTQLRFKSGPNDTGWSPAVTGPVTGTEETSIAITLAPDDAAALETRFGSQNVYLNTLAGWLTDAEGWQAAPLPDYSLLFSVVRH